MEVENKNSPNSAVDFYYVSGLTSVLYDHDHELIVFCLIHTTPHSHLHSLIHTLYSVSHSKV